MIYGTCLKNDTNLWNIFQFSEEAFQFAAKLWQSCTANSTLEKTLEAYSGNRKASSEEMKGLLQRMLGFYIHKFPECC